MAAAPLTPMGIGQPHRGPAIPQPATRVCRGNQAIAPIEDYEPGTVATSWPREAGWPPASARAGAGAGRVGAVRARVTSTSPHSDDLLRRLAGPRGPSSSGAAAAGRRPGRRSGRPAGRRWPLAEVEVGQALVLLAVAQEDALERPEDVARRQDHRRRGEDGEDRL